MDKPEGRPLDIFDVLLLLWIVIVAVLLSEDALGETLGKGRYLVSELILFIFSAAYLSARRQNLPELLRWRPVPLKALPGLILATIGAAPLLDGLDRLIAMFIPVPADYTELLTKAFSSTSGSELILVVLGVGIAAPLAEESIFRGAIQRILEKRRDVTGGVMLTALMFAAIHMQYWWFIQLLIMGVLLGFMAWSFNSIIPAVMLHAANNLMSLYLTMNPDTDLTKHYLMGSQLSPIVAVVSILLFGSGTYWAFKYRESPTRLANEDL